jgi:hypothetical protein
MMVTPVGLICVVMSVCATSTKAANWTCTYPGFSEDRKPVTVRLDLLDSVLIEHNYGVPIYRIVQNTDFAIIAENSNAIRDTGGLHVDISTIIIEKKTGRFLLTVSQINEETAWARGLCSYNERN